MIQLKLLGTPRLMKALSEASRSGNRRLVDGLKAAVLKIDAAAKRNLTGIKLKVRSGTLRSSLRTAVDALRLEGRVGTNVVYGPIHEYGGKTKAHIIRPRNKKVLAWKQVGGFITKGGKIQMYYGGKSKAARKHGWAYAQEVHHPGSKIKATHWLSDSYKSAQADIIEEFNRALQRTIQP